MVPVKIGSPPTMITTGLNENGRKVSRKPGAWWSNGAPNVTVSMESIARVMLMRSQNRKRCPSINSAASSSVAAGMAF